MRIATAAALGILLGIALPVAPGAAEMYRWTDASGVTRYTDRKPEAQVAALHRVERVDPAEAQAPVSVQKTVAPSLRSAIHRRATGRLVEVPFERVGQLIRVDVRLNDRVTAPFYLDTASTFVAITPSVARELGLAEEASRTSVGADTPSGRSQLGFAHLESLEIGGARLDGIEGTVNPNLDVGLLGGSFLNQFNYFIDTEGGVILLEPLPRSPKPDAH